MRLETSTTPILAPLSPRVRIWLAREPELVFGGGARAKPRPTPRLRSAQELDNELEGLMGASRDWLSPLGLLRGERVTKPAAGRRRSYPRGRRTTRLLCDI